MPLLVLPSSLWRVGLAAGLPLGYTEQGLRDIIGTTMWGPLYLVALAGLTEGAALLTLGVAVLTLLWTPFLFWWTLPHADMTGTGRLLVGLVYLPLVAWAPLLAAVTASYQRRRGVS
ncbi:hypothetical protein [Nonomuraea sp. NPDC050202]|uniref:hypothetical protein n=1 Tax=Nonomuraea sp. NPDC050202 TaxID=3155035 RepID=UPI0033EDBF46